MIWVTSRGGDGSDGPLTAFDFVENHLRTILGVVGLTDIRSFNVQPVDISLEARRDAQRKALREVRAFLDANDRVCAAPTRVAPGLPDGLKPLPLEEPEPTTG